MIRTTHTQRTVALTLLIAACAAALFGATPAAAQTGTPPAVTPAATAIAAPATQTIQQLRVQFLPEYDDPRVLVIIQGRFVTSGTNAMTFPAVVTFRLPGNAAVNQMASMDLTNSVPTPQEYTTAPDPVGSQWMLATYTLDNPHFFYEYYYNPIQGTTDKQIAFTFNSLQPIESLALEIQQPLKATNFGVTPPSTDVQQDNTWGFFYHLYDWGVLAPDTDVTWQIRYTKTDPASSLTREQVRSGPGGTATTATEVASPPSWVLPLAGAVALLVIAGVLALRARQPAPPRSPARGAETRARTAAAPVRAPQLSRSERAALRTAAPPSAAEDRERPAFCNRCGAPLQTDALFCHRCGKAVTAMTGGAPAAPVAPASVDSYAGAGLARAGAGAEDAVDAAGEDEERPGLRAVLARISPRLAFAAFAVLLVGALIWSATAGLGNPAPAASAADAPIDQQQMVAGAEVYVADCATCHGSRAEGGNGPALNSTGTAYLRGDSDLRTIVAQGRGSMPAWSDKLSAGEIEAVIYFIKRQWTPEQRQQQAGITP